MNKQLNTARNFRTNKTNSVARVESWELGILILHFFFIEKHFLYNKIPVCTLLSPDIFNRTWRNRHLVLI